MDDKKANQLIEITSMISEMVENGQINDYKYHYNEETNTLDISFSFRCHLWSLHRFLCQ